jgi:hypothetical protein
MTTLVDVVNGIGDYLVGKHFNDFEFKWSDELAIIGNVKIVVGRDYIGNKVIAKIHVFDVDMAVYVHVRASWVPFGCRKFSVELADPDCFIKVYNGICSVLSYRSDV